MSQREKISPLTLALIVLLFVVVMAASILLAVDLRNFRASEPTTTAAQPHFFLGRPPAENPDISAISAWMTFEYINNVFNLPAAYLKDALGISSTRYPKLSIRRYASSENMEVAVAVGRVKAAVQQYFFSNTVKP